MSSSTQPPDRDWIATYDPDDPELQAAIRRRYTRLRWIGVPIGIVVYLVVRTVLESQSGIDFDRTPDNLPTWLVLVLTVSFVAAAVLVVAGLALALRPSLRAAVRRNPQAVLNRAQSRRVGKQIGGQIPVLPHEMPFLRDVALGTNASRSGVVLLAGVVLFCVSRAAVADGAGAVVAGVAALGLALLGAFGLRRVVRARRFLRSAGTAPV